MIRSLIKEEKRRMKKEKWTRFQSTLCFKQSFGDYFA